jgi:hypothetical protein
MRDKKVFVYGVSSSGGVCGRSAFRPSIIKNFVVFLNGTAMVSFLFVVVLWVFLSLPRISEAALVENSGQSVEIMSVGSAQQETFKNNMKGVDDSGIVVMPSVVSSQSVSLQPSANLGSTELDLGLNFLRSAQSQNGNFGNSQNISSLIDTITVMNLFSSLGLSIDSNYQNALVWLDKQYYENTLSEALKLLALAKNGNDVLYNVEPLITRQNTDDGGFGYLVNYESDPVTTAAVLQVMDESGYVDYGNNPDYSKIRTLVFIINTQNLDGGFGETASSDSDIKSTALVLEALYPHRFETLSSGAVSVVIMDIVNNALAYLKQAQSVDGTWNGSLLDTALSYNILHKYGADLNYENQSFNYLKSQQNNTNGSFAGGSVYVTANALQALSWRLMDSSPDLTITNVQEVGALVNGVEAQFNITIKNIGRSSVASADARLYSFAEDYNWLPAGLTFLPSGTSLDPNQEIVISVLNPTGAFLGATKMKYYVETPGDSDESNNWHTKTVNFATSSTNDPAIQTYFIAHKYDSANGKPAIRYYWPLKSDPNRLNYVILYRKVGVTTWSAATVSNTSNMVTLGGLEEGATYQATVGVKNKNNSVITYFTNYSTIKTSATRSNYVGSASGLLTMNSTPLASSDLIGYGIPTSITDGSGNFAITNLQNGSAGIWSQGLENDKILTKFNVDVGLTTNGVRVFTRITEDVTAPVVNYVRLQNEPDFIINNNSTSIIEISASDDINTKEADLSYYNPNTGSWVFVGTIPLSGNVSAYGTHSWSVPAELFGNGFKLRAVVRDYAGNQSSLEYGPFTINDIINIAPIIDVTQPDGLFDNADTTYTITWTDSDPDSDASISLYYDTDGVGFNGTLITSGISEDNATNSYDWDTSSIAKGNYYVYATITDNIASPVSDYSTGVVAISHLPKPPTNLIAPISGATTIGLSWTAPTDAGGDIITGYQILRKLSTDASYGVIVANTNSVATTYEDSGLVVSTTYNYIVRTITSSGISGDSNIATVSTLTPIIPTIITPTAINITSTGATLGANVTSLGVPASILARGTCYGTTPAPTTNCLAEGGTTTGVFTHIRSGLNPNTLYYYRGYAINSTGTAYSADAAFTTSVVPINWNLFLDAFATGWGAVTSNVTVTAPSTEKAYAGTASIKLSVAKVNGTFQIKKTTGSQSTTGKTNLVFYFQPSVSIASSSIKVNLVDSGGVNLVAASLSSYGVSALSAGTWYAYTIPLSALNATSKQVNSVKFTFSKTGKYYIDEVKLQ